MAYRKELGQPADWALVLGFQSHLFDSYLLMQGSLTDPVRLYFHFHLNQQQGYKPVKLLYSIAHNGDGMCEGEIKSAHYSAH